MKNPSTICTVFEGHYHKGVAALVNSLIAHGYEGIVWAAYKGYLPPWADGATQEGGVAIKAINDKLSVHFVRLADTVFLPYCKPDFMLDVLENKMPNVEKIFFFDCDIIVKCRFSYFEEWVENGVALCEDVNSPLPTSHPLRFQWKHYFEKHGILVENRDNYYVNGGFIGLKQADKDILEKWRLVQDIMRAELKDIKTVGFKDRTNPFHRTDQDALNIAKDIADCTYSIADATAMDLQNYGYIMSHAVGEQKPWQKNWLLFVIKHGQRPTMTDRVFMNYIDTPLSIFSQKERFMKRWNMKLASALGRVLA